MSEISNLYSSKDTVYQTKGKRSNKDKHGDMKHVVYKDGVPSYTEVIKVRKKTEEESYQNDPASPNRIKGARTKTTERRSSEAATAKRIQKFTDRLKNAIRNSQTIWSEKDGIWISYQGSQGFLVKQFDSSNRMTDQQIMTKDEILESNIPGLLTTSWRIV